jgi:hypothetical protein
VDRDCLLLQACLAGVCVDVAMAGDAAAGETPASGLPCTYNHDCAAPLVCQNGVCEVECIQDRDCAAGYVCIQNRCWLSGTGPGIDAAAPPVDAPVVGGDATVPLGGGCRTTGDCVPPLQCKGGACEPQCTVSIDCPGGDVCIANVCVPTVPPGSGEGGVPTFDGAVPDGAPSGYGAPCRTNSDCQNTLLCAGGVCIYQCSNNFDCDTAHGYCCAPWHACVSGLACFSGTGDASVALCAGASCPIVATGQTKPEAIVVDTGYVYWNDYDPSGAVRACALGASCGASAIDIATAQDTPNALVLTTTDVWWVSYAQRALWSASKPGIDGGLGARLNDTNPGPQADGVVAYGSGFVTSQNSAIEYFDIAGHYTNRYGSTPLPSSLVIAPDADSIYWIEQRPPSTDVAFQSIVQNSYAQLYFEPGIAVLAVDDDWIYWGTTGAGAHIAGGPRNGPYGDGGSGFTVLASATEPKGIAVDTQYVYWTDFSDGTVNRVPKRGGAVLTLASNLSLPWGVAVGQAGVYWTNSGDGTVMWLAK